MIKSIRNTLNLRSLWEIVWEYPASQETGTDKNPIQETGREQPGLETTHGVYPYGLVASVGNIPLIHTDHCVTCFSSQGCQWP